MGGDPLASIDPLGLKPRTRIRIQPTIEEVIANWSVPSIVREIRENYNSTFLYQTIGLPGHSYNKNNIIDLSRILEGYKLIDQIQKYNLTYLSPKPSAGFKQEDLLQLETRLEAVMRIDAIKKSGYFNFKHDRAYYTQDDLNYLDQVFRDYQNGQCTATLPSYNVVDIDYLSSLLQTQNIFISPEGIPYFSKEQYDQEQFQYQSYFNNGGRRSFLDWRAEILPFTRTKNRTAEEVNAEFIDNGWEPPYKSGTQVTEYTNTTDETYVRFHFGPNEEGVWLVKKEAVIGLTPAEIKAKYSLKYEPTQVSDVVVKSGTRIRKGKVASNFDGNQGATQYEIIDSNWSNKLEFNNSRPIDRL
ncbi:MAG: hypothetical protein V3U87_09240 [Methylococcaceae bacterium]